MMLLVMMSVNIYVYFLVGVDGMVFVVFVGGFDMMNKNWVGYVYVMKFVDDGIMWMLFICVV